MAQDGLGFVRVDIGGDDPIGELASQLTAIIDKRDADKIWRLVQRALKNRVYNGTSNFTVAYQFFLLGIEALTCGKEDGPPGPLIDAVLLMIEANAKAHFKCEEADFPEPGGTLQ